jgi:thiosulfate/3-mercaptopyruvate sulfurtransferase
MLRSEPVVLIDTRDPALYAEAHIPDAVNLREVFTYLASSTPEGFWNTFETAFGKAGLGGGETAVVYGWQRDCRAPRLFPRQPKRNFP